MKNVPVICTLLLACVALIVCPGCSSSATPKVCTADEVKKCDADLDVCTTQAACSDARDPGWKACVDACRKQHCDCFTACGNTCT